MRVLNFKDANFSADVSLICQRSVVDRELDRQVDEILGCVRQRGDEALIDYAKQFDHVELSVSDFLVKRSEIEEAEAALSERSKQAIQRAYENVLTFSRKRVPQTWNFSPRQGVILGERYIPFSRIGAYIPGGQAPLASTVIHTITIAKAAGVPEIIVTTPVGASKKVDPAILYAASIGGATEIYRLGGVYAIGALAYGTDSIQPVEKIVGPGNAFVAAAKRKVYGHVALDLVAGPSEILIIADHDANPAFIAADMLAQGEHGSGHEIAVLLTDSDEVLRRVHQELHRQCNDLRRQHSIQSVLKNGTYLMRVRDLGQAIEFTNKFAPEHLEVLTQDPYNIVEKITTAGAIFIGAWTPEPVGDYVAGPSHVLPTTGAGRSFSGLTIDSFFRRISTVQYDERALAEESSIIEQFSRMENLDAHGRSVKIRFE